MKKKDKISLLMFKKADNTITSSELKKLNKYLEKNSDLKEEYVLIENLRNELNNYNQSPLPSDFKVKLREKLVDYNLSKSPSENKRKFFPVNTVATAVLAVFLIAFSFGTNFNYTNNTLEKEVEPSYNYKTSQLAEDKNDSELTSNAQKDITLNTRERVITEDKNNTINSPANLNENIIPEEKIISYEIIEENTNTENNVVAIEENVSSGGNVGGGGSSMATSPIYDFSHSVENIVIITNCDNSLFDNIKMEEIEKNIFKFDIKEYSNIINMLNDIPYEIKNFSEENLVKSYFYLVNEQ